MKRRCYYVPVDQFDPDRGYIPSLVVEDEQGHSPMCGPPGGAPWYWGKTYDEAKATCARVNQDQFGLSPREADAIVASSITAQIKSDSRVERARRRMEGRSESEAGGRA